MGYGVRTHSVWQTASLALSKKGFEKKLADLNVYFENIGKTSEKINIADDLKFNLQELSKINKEWFYKYNN